MIDCSLGIMNPPSVDSHALGLSTQSSTVPFADPRSVSLDHEIHDGASRKRGLDSSNAPGASLSNQSLQQPLSNAVQRTYLTWNELLSEPPAPPRKRTRLDDEVTFCAQCSAIDFERVFADADAHFSQGGAEADSHLLKRTLSTADGLLVMDLGSRLSECSPCSLCRFFWAMRIVPDNTSRYELRAYSSVTCNNYFRCPNKKNNQKLRKLENAFLAVVPSKPLRNPGRLLAETGSIYRALPYELPEQYEGFWGRRIGERVDFGLIQQWYQFCQKHHKGRCRSAGGRNNTNLNGFRLIDCETQPPTIVPAPRDAGYATLSYVWGADTGTSQQWPRAILDAIDVVKELGLRYLWVDRFCIDQENSREKHLLISKMADIYEKAELNIVAAGGFNATYGLAGVGSTKRKSQPHVEVGNMTLVSTLKDPREQLRQSKWWTRGWTYQEGVLSRRNLVFLEDQVYWECGGMVTHEALHVPLSAVHVNSMGHMREYIKSGILSGKREFSAFEARGSSEAVLWSEVVKHIENYSQKELTDSTDSLLAFVGIQECYSLRSRSKLGTIRIRFLLGLPAYFWTSPPSGKDHSALALAITGWHHANYLSKTSSFTGCQRLPHFPSWTWAGWRARVTWQTPGKDGGRFEEEVMWPLSAVYAAEFILSRESGEVITDLDALPFAPADSINLVLKISRPYLLREFDTMWSYRSNKTRLLLNGYNTWISLSVQGSWVDFKRAVSDGKYKCVWVYSSGSTNSWTRFLVLRSADRGDAEVWERVGTIALQISSRFRTLSWKIQEVIERLRLTRAESDFVLC